VRDRKPGMCRQVLQVRWKRSLYTPMGFANVSTGGREVATRAGTLLQ